jgi:hypothetical protein
MPAERLGEGDESLTDLLGGPGGRPSGFDEPRGALRRLRARINGAIILPGRLAAPVGGDPYSTVGDGGGGGGTGGDGGDGSGDGDRGGGGAGDGGVF